MRNSVRGMVLASRVIIEDDNAHDMIERVRADERNNRDFRRQRSRQRRDQREMTLEMKYY